jgi:carboxypeptidase PM20D1
MKTIIFIILTLLILFLILLSIALIRTVLLKAPKQFQKKACSRNNAELQEMGESFAKMIRIKTVSLPDDSNQMEPFDQLHTVIDELFPKCHEKLDRKVLHGGLIYHWKGSDRAAMPILLMGHQDVVPAEESEWQVPPYGGVIRDGKLWGRGTIDDKCNIFCQMSAVENLLNKGYVPPCDVYLAYSDNEEISGHNAESAVAWFEKCNIHFAAVWDEGGAIVDKAMPGMDRPYAVIGIAEKGYVDLKITAKGFGGHSSAPRSSTTVSRLTDFIHDVNHKKMFKREFTPQVSAMFTNMAPSFNFGMRLLLGNLWLFKPILTAVMPKISAQAGALLGTTCTFTMIHGSESSNVIPSEAYAVANLRTGFTEGVEESVAALQKIADKYDLTLEILTSREASPITSQDSAVFRYLEKCIADQYPDCGCSPYIMTGGTDSRHYSKICSNILKFYPIRLTSEELSAMHSKDECIDLEACSDAVDFYQYFLEHYKNEKSF